MRCDELGDKLSAYADGELDPAAGRDVEAHVRECAACRARLDEIRALQDRLCDAQPDALQPVDIADAVMARLPEAGPRSARRPCWRLAWALPVVIPAIALALLCLPQPPTRVPAVKQAIATRPTVKKQERVIKDAPRQSARVAEKQTPSKHAPKSLVAKPRTGYRRHTLVRRSKPVDAPVTIDISAKDVLAAVRERRVVNPPPDPIVQAARRPEIMPVVKVERM